MRGGGGGEGRGVQTPVQTRHRKVSPESIMKLWLRTNYQGLRQYVFRRSSSIPFLKFSFHAENMF